MSPGDEQSLETSQILSLEWQEWPLQKKGAKPKALIVLGLVSLVWLLLLVSLPLLNGIALSFALGLSLLPYYLPTYYNVDGKGITIGQLAGLRKQTRLWPQFIAYELKPNGILLKAPQTSGPISERNLFLPYPPDPTALNLLQQILQQNVKQG